MKSESYLMQVVLTSGGEICCQGTLGDFILGNQENLTLEEIDNACTALEGGKSCTWGGGAQPAFVLKRRSPVNFKHIYEN